MKSQLCFIHDMCTDAPTAIPISESSGQVFQLPTTALDHRSERMVNINILLLRQEKLQLKYSFIYATI
jgi:hypothetical protein